jgi:hypothetical protein
MNDVTIEDIEAELRARIEQQRAMIQVALGYIQSGRPDLAALLLGEKEAVPPEPQTEAWPCRQCNGVSAHYLLCSLHPRNLTQL